MLRATYGKDRRVNITRNKDKLTEKLQGAIDTEYTMSTCCNYLASLIKNGRIRNKFRSFSDEAKTNKGLLLDRLDSLGVTNFVVEDKCKFCKINPESFSLIGAVNLGLEVVNTAIKFYKDLLDFGDDIEDKKLFNKLLREKNKQRNFLKKEKKFVRKDEGKFNFIDDYCIPVVISKLWK